MKTIFSLTVLMSILALTTITQAGQTYRSTTYVNGKRVHLERTVTKTPKVKVATTVTKVKSSTCTCRATGICVCGPNCSCP